MTDVLGFSLDEANHIGASGAVVRIKPKANSTLSCGGQIHVDAQRSLTPRTAYDVE